MKKTGQRLESSSERRAELSGFVDVLTELDKMARWGADRRHHVGLTVRQRIMLSMASLRSSIYIYISCWLGMGSMYLAWRMFGAYGAVVMFFAVMFPAVATVTWLTVRMSKGEGSVWSEAARRVCLGLAEGAACVLFVNVMLLALGLLLRRGVIALSRELTELLEWAFEGTGVSENWLASIQTVWGGVNMTVRDGLLLGIAILAVTVACVAIPTGVYIFGHVREERTARKVKEMFS